MKSAYLQASEALKAKSPKAWKWRGIGHPKDSEEPGEQAKFFF